MRPRRRACRAPTRAAPRGSRPREPCSRKRASRPGHSARLSVGVAFEPPPRGPGARRSVSRRRVSTRARTRPPRPPPRGSARSAAPRSPRWPWATRQRPWVKIGRVRARSRAETHRARRPILRAVRDVRLAQRRDARGEVLVPRRVADPHSLEPLGLGRRKHEGVTAVRAITIGDAPQVQKLPATRRAHPVASRRHRAAEHPVVCLDLRRRRPGRARCAHSGRHAVTTENSPGARHDVAGRRRRQKAASAPAVAVLPTRGAPRRAHRERARSAGFP